VPQASAESPLHQPSTIRLRGLVRFLVGFIVIAAAIHFIVWVVFAAFRAEEQRKDLPASGAGQMNLPPPEPRIQPSLGHDALPVSDVAAMRAQELAEYRRRGWIDEATGRVRIKPEIADEVIRMSGGTPVQAPAGRAVPNLPAAMGSTAVTQPDAVVAFPNRGGATTEPATKP